MVVVDVVDVGLDEDDDSRFLFTMLDRPVEAQGSGLREEGGGQTTRRVGELCRAVGVRGEATGRCRCARKFVPERKGLW